MKKSLLLVAIVLFVSAFAQVFAQDHGPPPVLLVVREDIKPGMMAVHSRHAAEFANAFGKLQTPNYRIALVPVAGSENEVLYITGAGTFAELEGMQKATDQKLGAVTGMMKADMARLDKEAPDLHAGMRDMFAILRSDLSYNPGVAIATMRYFAITTVRVRFGHEAEYAELVKITNAAREKAKAELHVAAFQVIAGTGANTYLNFRPMKSIADYDLKIAARVRAAMTEDQQKRVDKLANDAIAGSESSIYAMTPAMSYVSKEMMAGDPTFWTPKPMVVAKPRPKKHKPATAAVSPAQ
jgi:hypothetical protein